MPFDVFISYTRKDKKLRDQLVIYLSTMRCQGLIQNWDEEELLPGTEREKQIVEHLNKAHVILLLISPDFLASAYCYQQMQRALVRQKTQSVHVIPILLRPTDIDRTLFGELQVLPRNNKPISKWSGRDEAFLETIQGIRIVIESATRQQDSITSNGVVMPTTAPLWNIPFRRNLLFTGRKETLQKIYDVLSSRHVVALSGLGGIGKTQIAIEYAYRHRDEYQAVLWVRANTAEELLADFVSMAEVLNLPERNAETQEIVVKAVLQWFAEQKDWLLIFDNADDFKVIHPYLPSSDGGHILLTTRTQIMSGMAKKIEINQMEKEEAILLLLHRAGIAASGELQPEMVQEIHAQAAEIVRELDGLPLALDQAGAYVEETGCGLSTYLTLYHKQHTQLLAYRGGIALDYPLAVSATWQLSFQAVERGHPASSELLRLCAFFSADAIPEEILTEGAAFLGPSLESIATDDFALNEAIKVLLRYSLLYRDPLNRTLTVHRLVQLVIQDNMDEATQKIWAERAIEALDTVIPSPYKNRSRYPRYLAHALACVSHIERWHLESLKAAHLLYQVALYLFHISHMAAAQPLLQHALTMRKKLLGQEHPDVARVLSLLGHISYGLGQYSEVTLLYQRALTIYEKAHGPEHSDTLRLHYDLARLHRRLGNYTEAAMLYQKTLALQEKVLGPEHPQALDSLQELAEIYRRQGKYAEALPLLERALTTQKKASEPDYINIALTLYYLASVHDNLKMYTEALPLATEALSIVERELGAEHLNAATYRTLVAQIYKRQGNYAEALPLLQETYATYEMLLGAKHLHTATVLEDLALVYDKQGNASEALAYFQRALAIAERVLQADHPDMAKFLSLFAEFYHNQGRYTEALSLYQRALAIQEQALGTDHPTTIKTREHITALLNKTGIDT